MLIVANMIRAFMLVTTLLPAFAFAADCAGSKPSFNSDITVTIDPATIWQPRGGHVKIVVESHNIPLADLVPVACFRWSDDDTASYRSSSPIELFATTGLGVHARMIYLVTVPIEALAPVPSLWPFRLFAWPHRWAPNSSMRFDGADTVPLAQLRFILASTDGTAVVDVVKDVGVTSIAAAATVAALMASLSVIVLLIWAKSRKIPGHWAFMRLIASRAGYASLSQLQIMIWSFLLGTGAVYVMMLSGSLIEIPTSALVLLGIAGVSAIGAKIRAGNAAAENDAPSAPPPNAAATPPGPVQNLAVSGQTDDGVALSWTIPAVGDLPQCYRVEYCRSGMLDWRIANAGITSMSCRVGGLSHGSRYTLQVFAVNGAGSGPGVSVDATTLAPVMVTREPQWSDLVVTPVHPGEIDVTRVQMLFFTLISAAFVAIKLFTSYTIPIIPDGFMLLMGISNGVYLTSKFTPD